MDSTSLEAMPSFATLAMLGGMLTIALGFEFVNGFHDTANAVATVIYTRSLTARWAVLWSAICNFAGVMVGGTAVAFGIVNLLPADMLGVVGTGGGTSMILAILVAAILWNLGTWWLGLPSSSSHTLIGAILGVGIVHSYQTHRSLSQGVNWHAAGEAGLSLLISPLVGFVAAAFLLWSARVLVPDPKLYEPAKADEPPPGWIRGLLITTCTGVSFAHGSNDGQKGVGIIMLVLIGMLPSHYLLNRSAGPHQMQLVREAASDLEAMIERHKPPEEITDLSSRTVHDDFETIRQAIGDRKSPRAIPIEDRRRLRSVILKIAEGLEKWVEAGDARFSERDVEFLKSRRLRLLGLVEYAPTWVMMAVAAALGLGTTVGWKRIVETVGEKIGNTHLSYAQGACAELVAMSTIGLADLGGLPVSTTHVLSSGVAGTMAAGGSGVQFKTIRNILLAWIFTLPASMAMSGGLFLFFRYVSQTFFSKLF